MNKKIKKFRNKIKKSKSQIENLKLTVELSVFVLLVIAVIAYFSRSAFFVDGYLQVNEWTTNIISLIGAFIGGIFTMLGVVFTLNKSISNQEKKEREYLKTQIFIVKSEIEAHVESVEDFIILTMKKEVEKLDSSWDKLGGFNNLFMSTETIYFMSDNIREVFYEVLKNIDIDNKKEYINAFIGLYTSQEAIRDYLNKDRDSLSILDKVIVKNLKIDFFEKKLNLFKKIEKIENKKIYKPEELEILKKDIEECQKLLNKDGTLRDSTIKLLNLFRRLYDEYNA